MAKKIKVGTKIPTKNELSKRYPNMIIAKDIDDSRLPVLPSRMLAFNYQLGGGIPYGKILEIFGEESSGKSMMAYDFAYAAQQLGGVVLWADAEQSFTNAWAEINGLDLERVILIRETSVETISDWIADMSIYWRSQLTNNEPILFVLDSMAALDCMENINSKMVDSKADMGNRAKAIYKMFRIRSELLFKLGICQIYINQLRKNLKAGMFEDPDTTPGGNAMKFYASLRIGFYGGKSITQKIKGKDRRIGRVTSIRVKKNKVAPPRASMKAVPMYNNPDYHEVGFDKIFLLSDVLLEKGLITKSSGGVYSYKGETLCRGEEKFQKMLEEDDDFRRKLLRKADINTIGTLRKKLDKIGENMFPIDGDIDIEKQSEITEDEEDGE
ncbi:MAG: hypothetical protein RSC49_02100 [Clostridium sp.]